MKRSVLFAFVICLTISRYGHAHMAAADRLAGVLPSEAMQDPKKPLVAIDWSQPPIGCVEEMVAGTPDRPCLDLSRVADALSDWPTDLNHSDQQYWYSHRRFLTVCRTQEVLKREALHPGSQGAVHVENSWMIQDSIAHHDEAVNAIYEANRLYEVPLQILTGAIYQESLFATLGISDDGGNYSCGVGQTNVIGWCQWANVQSESDKLAMNWPLQKVDCNDESLINLNFIEPLYALAKTHLQGLPEYRLTKEMFEAVPFEAIVPSWPQASAARQKLRYQLIQSFFENCSDTRRGILVAASEIAAIYRADISAAFQQKDQYANGEHFNRNCRQKDTGSAYPLHTGWLMAVGIYNAGPRVPAVVSYYNGWSRSDYHDSSVIQGFTPDQIVESLYWGGKYDHATDLIDFTGFNGNPDSWLFYKACVVQRHVARVMQNVTLLPEFFVEDLEGQYPCAKSVFENGQLVQSLVPEFRQTSSGVKDGVEKKR